MARSSGPRRRRNGVATQFRSRNHKYSALAWKDLSYYHSMGLEFRYEDGKEGVRHLTRGSTFTHCILRLNLIKGKFNIHHYTLTHTLAYI